MAVRTSAKLARERRIAGHLAKLGASDIEIGSRAERNLIRFYGAAAVPYVRTLCASENRIERYRAVWILGHAKQVEDFETILGMCDDEDEGVRYDAVLALGIHGDPRAAPILVKIARRRDPTRPGVDALRRWRVANGRARADRP